MYMDQVHPRHTLNNNEIVEADGQAVITSSTTVPSSSSRVAVDGQVLMISPFIMPSLSSQVTIDG